jgi:hypothetical protein
MGSLVTRYINISWGSPYRILYGKSLLFRGTPWELPRTFGPTLRLARQLVRSGGRARGRHLLRCGDRERRLRDGGPDRVRRQVRRCLRRFLRPVPEDALRAAEPGTDGLVGRAALDVHGVAAEGAAAASARALQLEPGRPVLRH